MKRTVTTDAGHTYPGKGPTPSPVRLLVGVAGVTCLPLICSDLRAALLARWLVCSTRAPALCREEQDHGAAHAVPPCHGRPSNLMQMERKAATWGLRPDCPASGRGGGQSPRTPAARSSFYGSGPAVGGGPGGVRTRPMPRRVPAPLRSPSSRFIRNLRKQKGVPGSGLSVLSAGKPGNRRELSVL